MADNKEKVTAFRNLLRENRKIVLEHNGTRYKAKTVIQVLYSSRDIRGNVRKCHAHNCSGAATSVHVVMVCGEVVFLVEVWEGCVCHDGEVDVSSFGEKQDLEPFLKASPHGYEYKEILDAVFPHPSSQSSSSSESDSY